MLSAYCVGGGPGQKHLWTREETVNHFHHDNHYSYNHYQQQQQQQQPENEDAARTRAL